MLMLQPSRPAATMTLRSSVSVLQGLPSVVDADLNTAPGVVRYSVRAGQLVEVVDDLGDGRWSCRPLGPAHKPACRVELTHNDLATALTPRQLDATGHPDRITDRARFVVTWRCRVLEDHGRRAGAAADTIVGAALPVDDIGRPSVVLLDRAGRRQLAPEAGMPAAGFSRLVTDLYRAGLLAATTVPGSGVPAAELTLPEATYPSLSGRAI